jgi:hypothetical protein
LGAHEPGASRGARFSAGNGWLKEAAKPGIAVIGHFSKDLPDYRALADALGAKKFDVGPEAWDAMTAAEREAANHGFLDDIIRSHDTVYLSTFIDDVKPGSSLADEVQYLEAAGYEVSPEGWKLLPPP